MQVARQGIAALAVEATHLLQHMGWALIPCAETGVWNPQRHLQLSGGHGDIVLCLTQHIELNVLKVQSTPDQYARSTTVSTDTNRFRNPLSVAARVVLEDSYQDLFLASRPMRPPHPVCTQYTALERHKEILVAVLKHDSNSHTQGTSNPDQYTSILVLAMCLTVAASCSSTAVLIVRRNASTGPAGSDTQQHCS